MKKLLGILALMCMALSCEIPFELDQKGSARLYVQCIAEDGTVRVFPRAAAPVNSSAVPGKLEGIQVQVQVNGSEAGLATEQEEGVYTLRGLDLVPGDEVSVHVEAPGLDPVSGSTRVMEKPTVADCSWKKVQVDTIEAVEVALTLSHAPEEGEYYGIKITNYLEIRYMDGGADTFVTYLTPGYILTAAESGSFNLEDFLQLNYDEGGLGGNTYNPLTLLSKRQFDGPVYRFYLNSFDSRILDSIRDRMPGGDTGMAGGGIVSGEVGPGSGGTTPPVDIGKTPIGTSSVYYFSFYRLSPEFYFYAKALYQSNFDFLSNMGLIPANFTWSNVEGGLGFVGAVSQHTVGPFAIEM